MYGDFEVVLVFMLLGFAMVAGTLVFGWFIRLQKPNKAKRAIYECGEPTIGSAWIRYNSRFYTVALVYLLFDVEVVLMFPAAVVLKDAAAGGWGYAALGVLLLFMALLTLGLVYEWRCGNLDWIVPGGGKYRQAGEVSASEDASHGG